MNKTERLSVLSKALNDTFNPQFIELKSLLRAEIAKQIPQRFIELINDNEANEYITKYSVQCIYLSLPTNEKQKIQALKPRYTARSGQEPPTYIYSCDEDFLKIRISDLTVPHGLREPTLDNVAIFEQYESLWKNYRTAHQKLYNLLLSYKSRNKFAMDFPELQKYLPPKPEAAKLPVIQVNQARTELAKLGIPTTHNGDAA